MIASHSSSDDRASLGAMRRRAIGFSAVALAALPVLTGQIRPLDYSGGHSRDEVKRMERNSSAMATLLGEFRTSLSDILFIKTERYLHSGVAYVPHMDEKLLSVDGMTHELAEHQEEVGEIDDDGEADAGTATLIPTAAADYRGFIGWLEREVKPWRDPNKPHLHTDGKQLLPWFRVMTLSDPHYVRGYSVGAWWLIHRNLDEALAFAEEGLRNNPEAFEIGYILGQILLNRARVLEAEGAPEAEQRDVLVQALGAYRNAAEQALQQKMAMAASAEDGMGWTRYQEEDAMASARMAVMMERRVGDPNRADAMAHHFNRAFPEDDVLRRLASGNGGG